ncbi:hypothetical protein PanWU01x14_371110, partial [Parasponia andersonii]
MVLPAIQFHAAFSTFLGTTSAIRFRRIKLELSVPRGYKDRILIGIRY